MKLAITQQQGLVVTIPICMGTKNGGTIRNVRDSRRGRKMTDIKNRIHLQLNDIIVVEVESGELTFDALEQKALGLLEYLKEQGYPSTKKEDVGIA